MTSGLLIKMTLNKEKKESLNDEHELKLSCEKMIIFIFFLFISIDLADTI